MKGTKKMLNEKAKQLEKRLVEVFGNKASLAITNARLGYKGYYTRIEAYGMPFRVDAYKPTVDESEELALDEFNKQMDIALKESLFPTQPEDRYEPIELTEEELDKLYKYTDLGDVEEALNEIKEETSAKMCQLSDGRYECVITGPYMQLNARSTGGTKKLAIATTIWSAHEIFSPTPIKIGDWPIK